MGIAAQLGDRAAAELPPPEVRRHGTPNAPSTTTPSAATANSFLPHSNKEIPPVLDPTGTPTLAKPKPVKHVQEIAFKDIVESWCAEQGLIMLPLREAHPQNGLPLFRLTASATGKGGVLVFMQGDVVWAQNRKARDIWEPMGLEDKLVERAEGK